MNAKILVWWCVIYLVNFLTGDLFAPILVLFGLLLMTWTRGKLFFVNLRPLIIYFFIGLLGIVNHQLRHIFRDIIFALLPIALMFLGYWLAFHKVTLQSVLRVLVFFSLFFSLIHLIQFFIEPSLFGQDVDVIRANVFNPGGGLIVFSLALAMNRRRLQILGFFRNTVLRYLCILLLSSSFVLSYSRTNLTMFILLNLSLLGFFERLNLKRILVFVLIISLSIFLITNISDYTQNSFITKIMKSSSEIMISDYDDLSDIHSNWRGFEAYRAFSEIQSANALNKICGFGFGSLVDLGFTMTIGELDYDKIPILHNGYMYILFKTGISGLCLYFIYFLLVIRDGILLRRLGNSENVVLSRFLIGLILCLMSSMLVVGGMAEIHDAEFVLLVGFFTYRPPAVDKIV